MIIFGTFNALCCADRRITTDVRNTNFKTEPEEAEQYLKENEKKKIEFLANHLITRIEISHKN